MTQVYRDGLAAARTTVGRRRQRVLERMDSLSPSLLLLMPKMQRRLTMARAAVVVSLDDLQTIEDVDLRLDALDALVDEADAQIVKLMHQPRRILAPTWMALGLLVFPFALVAIHFGGRLLF